MAIINILSFVVIAFAAGYLLKQPLSDMLPFVWCGLISVLFLLSFSQSLNLIDFILPGCTLALLFMVYRKSKNLGQSFVLYAKEEALSAPFLIYVLLTVIIALCVKDKVVTWWDDINFWASDVKSIYYLNGFASKFANVSPEYGDYPPGTQLAKWFVLHMDPKNFREGFAFIGYYMFNFSFLMPLFKNVKKNRLWLVFPLTIVCWLFSGVVDKFGYEGFCADLSMAYIFGGILMAAFDRKKDNELFEFLRISLYLGIIVLCKSTGAIWAIFGIVFYVVVAVLDMTNVTFKAILREISACIYPAFTGACWLSYCLVGHRVAKATSTAVVYLTSDKYALSEYRYSFAQAYAKAFLIEPLHVDKTFLYLSPIGFLVLSTIALVVLYKKKVITGKKGLFTCISLPIMGILYYVIIFISHLTVFATETQYLESGVMVASIERYGLPFAVGSLMLLTYFWLNEVEVKFAIRYAVLILGVILFTDIPEAYEGIIGYRSSVDEAIDEREEFINDDSHAFIDALNSSLPDGDVRVCHLQDYSNHRVQDVYVGYEVSPVSVVNLSVDLSQIDEANLISQIAATRATYLYVEEQDNDGGVITQMSKNSEFSYGKLYYISYEDGTMVLYEFLYE